MTDLQHEYPTFTLDMDYRGFSPKNDTKMHIIFALPVSLLTMTEVEIVEVPGLLM